MRNHHVSRRTVLKAGAGMVTALGGSGAIVPGTLGAARQNYQGKFTVFSVRDVENSGPIVDAITAAYPDVEVEWRFATSERFVELFTAAEVAGDQIDLIDLNGQDLRRYAVGDRLADLSGLDYLDRFRPVGLETYTINDSLWALPWGGIGGFSFFYNQKLFDQIGATEPPQTYDDLLAMAPDLKAVGASPFVHNGQVIYLWPIWQFWAYAQTTGNRAIENTIATLKGEMKFTDPEHVAALEILYRFAQDELFNESVLSADRDAALLLFTQGKAAFYYTHTGTIGEYERGDFPELDMKLMPPVSAVADAAVERQLPGGTGSALTKYAKIEESRSALADEVMELITRDETVAWMNEFNGDPVSCNANVVASESPLALSYAETCSPLQITYLDWFWPPEVTRSFQENQQKLVSGDTNPEDAAAAIQQVLEDLYFDGYEFE
ncbi:MAG: ABC transporter substrate-binding protein [Chloroflexota bacterium]|nr:ABC transporter substrate-binding protein [Chloroflexota bacterium]